MAPGQPTPTLDTIMEITSIATELHEYQQEHMRLAYQKGLLQKSREEKAELPK